MSSLNEANTTGHSLLCEVKLSPDGNLKIDATFGSFEFKATTEIPKHILSSLEDLLNGKRPL